MIKKLNQRIFLLLMVSLSIIILGTIILFAFLNYNNTISTSTSMMDRFMYGEQKRVPNEKVDDYKIKPEINIEGLYNVVIRDSAIVQNFNAQNDRATREFGMLNDVEVNESNAQNDRVTNESTVSNNSESVTPTDNTINEYALKISKQNSEKGIIGKYIYKSRRINPSTTIVTLMENENVISHIRIMFILSGIMAIVSIIIIYVIAKKVSKTIVKPVAETFEKQKQFISDASHELKTPLAVIEANADVLENKVGTNKWIQYIQNEADSMNNLINELLLLTKIENIDNLKEHTELNLSKEVEIILSMFESMAYEKQVNIKSNIEEDIIINGNKEDIEHIVSTLTDNAIKHTKDKKDVVVNLKKEKNEIILEVKNMGEKIPEEEREKIFERFYRIDKSRNRKEKRYGLGLAIAKSTVEKYNGKIEVSYKDKFTIFKVIIPN